MIEIVLAIHDADGHYVRHAGATLASVFANTVQPVCAHILHDDTLTPLNLGRLEHMAQAAGQSVCFHPVRLPEELASIETGPFTMAALYRLMLPELVAVDRILYLDCDIIVDLDISELWNESLDGQPIGAVLDRGVRELDPDHQRRLRRAGLLLDHYFNSGVMIFDLDVIRREHDLIGGLLSFVRRFPESMMVDQDFLNRTFQENYCCLPEKYNTLVKRCTDLNYCNDKYGTGRKIWHFSGLKPWNRYESRLDAYYWRALAQTPWREQALEGLLGAVDSKMQQMLNSRSWRLTRPYRAAGDWVRSRLGWFR